MPAQRIAVVSSPRSGNSWVVLSLAAALEMKSIAVHDYHAAADLPDRCILQCHWYREPHFQAFLRDRGFQVLVVARNPLDILLSVLHYVRHEPETQSWLLGNCEIPPELSRADPTSNVFRDYCLGFGAENLLCVTYQWWHEPTALKVRYEQLVADPDGWFGALAMTLGYPAETLGSSDRRVGFDMFKALPNRHGWQGVAGSGSRMIPQALAEEIHDRHRRLFELCGYAAPVGGPSRDEALLHWRSAMIEPDRAGG